MAKNPPPAQLEEPATHLLLSIEAANAVVQYIRAAPTPRGVGAGTAMDILHSLGTCQTVHVSTEEAPQGKVDTD